ncbi:Ig-like domain-containing protein [Chloroflexota bacterium]
MPRVTLEEKDLLADALGRARAAGERDDSISLFRTTNRYHGGYVDFVGVESLVPNDGDLAVAKNTNPAIEFDMDVTGNDLDGVTIIDEDGTPKTLTSVVLVGRTITITPDGDMTGSKVQTVTIPADTVRDAQGLGNKQTVWSFTTAA